MTILRLWETSGMVFGTPNMIQKGNRFKIQPKSLFHPSLQHWAGLEHVPGFASPSWKLNTQLLLTYLCKERGGGMSSHFQLPWHSGRRALTRILAVFVPDLPTRSPHIKSRWVRAGRALLKHSLRLWLWWDVPKFLLLSSWGRKQQRHGSPQSEGSGIKAEPCIHPQRVGELLFEEGPAVMSPWFQPSFPGRAGRSVRAQ